MDFLKKDVRDYFFKQYPDIYSKVEDYRRQSTTVVHRSATALYQAAALSTVQLKIRFCLKRFISEITV